MDILSDAQLVQLISKYLLLRVVHLDDINHKYSSMRLLVGACGSALQMGNLLHMAGQLGRAVESFHPELYEDEDDLSDGDMIDAAFRNQHHHLAAGID